MVHQALNSPFHRKRLYGLHMAFPRVSLPFYRLSWAYPVSKVDPRHRVARTTGKESGGQALELMWFGRSHRQLYLYGSFSNLKFSDSAQLAERANRISDRLKSAAGRCLESLIFDVRSLSRLYYMAKLA